MFLGAANRINGRIARLADKTEVLLAVGKLADGTVNTSKREKRKAEKDNTETLLRLSFVIYSRQILRARRTCLINAVIGQVATANPRAFVTGSKC
jgi:hypothetical protein